MRTVVFDLDGTLADTSGDLIAAANACFEGLGAGPLLDPATDALVALRGGKAMLRLGFQRLGTGSEAEVDAQYPVLLAAYARAIDTHTRLYPGAVAAIEALRDAGFVCAVCTNKPAGLAETLLTNLGVRRHFAALVGADTLPTRKPDPAPYRLAVEAAGGTVARSFLIGDTETDHQTARSAAVPSVLVTFGPEGQGIARLNPDALLHRYEDLAALAETLLSASSLA
jgi:phosphoglycolate phosphatase